LRPILSFPVTSVAEFWRPALAELRKSADTFIYLFRVIQATMKRKYTLIVEKDEDGWLVSEVVELPGCHTQAKNMNQLLERTKEAIQAYLGTGKAPEISEEFIGVQQIEV